MPAPVRTPSLAPWTLTISGTRGETDIDALRADITDVAARSQYGWGHTIDFGPFTMDGVLGAKYRRIVGALDAWGWMPDLDGARVGDVGCFSGGISALLAARGVAEVIAVDEVPEHLEQCELVARAFSFDQIRCVRASVYDLKDHVEAGSLDVVVLGGVLYHLSDMLVGLLAVQELLRPGGVLLLETNAVECFDHSYANFGRYFGGMWWQPTALCVQDLCEQVGFARPEVRFFQPGRLLARVEKPAVANVPFRRGLHWPVTDHRDDIERGLDPAVMAPAPCNHAEAAMVGRFLRAAAERAVRAPMQLGYRWRRATRRSQLR